MDVDLANGPERPAGEQLAKDWVEAVLAAGNRLRDPQASTEETDLFLNLAIDNLKLNAGSHERAETILIHAVNRLAQLVRVLLTVACQPQYTLEGIAIDENSTAEQFRRFTEIRTELWYRILAIELYPESPQEPSPG